MAYNLKVFFIDKSALNSQEYTNVTSFTNDSHGEFLLLFGKDEDIPMAMLRTDKLLSVEIKPTEEKDG